MNKLIYLSLGISILALALSIFALMYSVLFGGTTFINN